MPYDPENLDEKTASKYSHRDPDGRIYRLDNLINPNPDRPNLTYEFLGVRRVWRWTKDRMQDAYERGLVVQTRPGAVPQLKRYLDEQEGRPIDTVWTDIPPINSQAKERLGYPTQKPLALLERIVKASSNEGDIVLDAFCGCGTALLAAENLKRQWIGIDQSPTACRVMAKRLRDNTILREDEKLWKIGRGFVVRDLPWTVDQLRKIPPFEFENWAVIALGGIPNKTQVGDMGIDGRIYPISATPDRRGKDTGHLDFMDVVSRPSETKGSRRAARHRFLRSDDASRRQAKGILHLVRLFTGCVKGNRRVFSQERTGNRAANGSGDSGRADRAEARIARSR